MDGEPAVHYVIAQAWVTTPDKRCRSSVCVVAGTALRGTFVSFEERPFEAPAVRILMNGAARARILDADRIEDHFLGSDFIYDDLRLWTPNVLANSERIVSAEEGVVVLQSRWRDRAGKLVVGRVEVSEELGLILAAAWYRDPESEPFRTLRLDEVDVLDGVATPQRMTVDRPAAGYTSRLTLIEQSLEVDVARCIVTDNDASVAAFVDARDALISPSR